MLKQDYIMLIMNYGNTIFDAAAIGINNLHVHSKELHNGLSSPLEIIK